MIFYLYGDDTVRSRQRRIQLMEKFKRDVDPSGLNLTRIDGNTVDAATLGQALSATPFLARRRMVVLERVFENKDEAALDTLEHFFKKETKDLGTDPTSYQLPATSADDTIVVIWEDGTPTKALAKRLAKLPHAEVFAGMNEADAIRWAIERAKSFGAELDTRTATALVERFPGNIWALATEIHKLCAYARSRIQNLGYRIEGDDVDALSSAFVETPVYVISNAVETGSLSGAAMQSRQLLAEGTAPLVLVAMVSKVLTNLLAAQRGALAGLKLHPYVAKKTNDLSACIAPNALMEATDASLELEYKMKTTRLNSEVALLRMLDRATRLRQRDAS